MKSDRKKRAAIALSGGVDSATAAALLVEQGYDVIGLTMQLWNHGDSPAPSSGRTCCSTEDIYDARRVAETLGIPFYVVNYESLFETHVVDNFVESYRAGLTPNPCIRCNQILKFEHLLARARSLGADFLATGHYARRHMAHLPDQNSPHTDTHPIQMDSIEMDSIHGDSTSSPTPMLHRGEDPKKDQSYFLCFTTRDQLHYLRFPLGDLTKDETRQIAQRHGLHLHEKRESQDLCFVPDGNYGTFFASRGGIGLTPGDVIDTSGKTLGRHHGIARYTIGQRKGLGIAAPHPLYVIAIDAPQNRLIVGPQEDLYRDTLTLQEVNWLLPAPPDAPLAVTARIRYAMEPAPALVEPVGSCSVHLRFDEPQRAVTPGQACALYVGDRVVGGGWIA